MIGVGERSLACLETLAHLSTGGLSFNRILVHIDIPDDLMAAARTEDSDTLPVAWDVEPAGRASIAFDQQWLLAIGSASLIVPSAIVPEEQNILINPRHPEALRIKATKVRRWIYDARLV